MIDKVINRIRRPMPCGCLYDPNGEGVHPGSGSVAVQGECQIAFERWIQNPSDENRSAMRQVAGRHKVYKENLRINPA